MMLFLACVVASVCATHAYWPPDKDPRAHRIRARSININNVQKLVRESRLHGPIQPTFYGLEFEPYIEDGVYKGHVYMDIYFSMDTSVITLHCDPSIEITEYGLKVDMVENKKVEEFGIKEFSTDPKRSTITLTLVYSVPKAHKGFLDIRFKGKLQTLSNEGFFKTTYMEQETEKFAVGTQLRPTNARKMFPCFDEPQFKTSFLISVVRPKNMVALSNRRIVKVEKIPDEPNAEWVHFEKTPPMPLYGINLVIADIKELAMPIHYKDNNGNNVEIRVWGREEFLPSLKGLDQKVLRVFSEMADYFVVTFPLKRLDIIALPNYRGAKPADGWGIIAFKESDLAKCGYLQLAQELAYQWVGMLITPKWWNEMHINKALANYVAADVTFKIDNGTEMEGKWPMTVLYSLYYEYSKRHPHSRITGMKQETTCTKMEMLFRMFNYTLGEETFRKGLKILLFERKFVTFTDSDIWGSLQKAAGEDKKLPPNVSIKDVANSWINQDRLPLVTVERKYDPENTFSITQSLYLRERPHDVPNADKMSWELPIVILYEKDLNSPTPWSPYRDNNTLSVHWGHKHLTDEEGPDNDQFMIVNPEEIAPFPVNYDEHNWGLIAKYLQGVNRLRIPELTRAKLLHDAWNLAFAGQLSFKPALDMTLFMRHERNHIVWDPVFTMINHLGRHMWIIRDKFQAYVRIMLIPLHEELYADMKDDEEIWRKNLRGLARTFLCQAAWRPCITEAQEQYKKWMDVKNPDAGNPIANRYICPVFKYGTRKEWEFGLQRIINFPSSRKQNERTFLLKNLAGCPIDEAKITRLLDVIVLEGNSNFTETDISLIFSMLMGNSAGYTTLFNFLDVNWDVLKEKFRSNTNLWDNLITSATSQFTTKRDLELVTTFYKNHRGEFASAEHLIEKSIRNIKEEAEWTINNIDVIHQWLEQFLVNSDLRDDKYVADTVA